MGDRYIKKDAGFYASVSGANSTASEIASGSESHMIGVSSGSIRRSP